MRQSYEIAKVLFDSEIVSVVSGKPVTNFSGLSVPLYVHTSRLISHPKQRDYFLKKLASNLRNNFSETQAIAARVGSGSPWATLLASYLNLPLVLIRGEDKKYSFQNDCDGEMDPNWNVLIVEVSVFSGSSINSVYQRIKEMGVVPFGLLTFIDFGLERTQRSYLDINLQRSSLTDLRSILHIGENMNHISQEQISNVNKWRASQEEKHSSLSI